MSNDVFGVIKSAAAARLAGPKLAELKKATEGFESIFLKKLFSQMRSSVHETSTGGDNFGKEIYNDMFDEAFANAASKSNSLGMGDMLYRQFSPRVVGMARQELEQSLHQTEIARKAAVTVNQPAPLSGEIKTRHELINTGTADAKPGKQSSDR